MSHERLRPNFAIDQEKLKEIRKLVPEAFADGKINWQTLKEALGEFTEDEGPDAEHFGLFWHGKREARKIAVLPSKGTLVPVSGEGVDEETTRNIFIEGENLEVLKLLQKSYEGRIKMIYIDPPYNTGNDFVYEDDFTEPLDEYLRRTGQVDEEGKPLTTNTRIDGRFHSKWLSMMFSRLKLARNLLREDGIIFISIDDNEVHNLRQIMNEIFGEENFLGQLVWKKKYIGGKHARHFVDLHEYIIVYARAIDLLEELLIPRPAREKEKFDLEDEYVKERGKYYTRPLKSNLGFRKTLIYPIKLPDGSEIKTQWMVARETFDNLVKDGRIIYKEKKDGSYQVYRKFYELDNDGRVKMPTLIDDVANADGKVELKEIFGTKEGRDIIFPNPKPTGLIKHLCEPILKTGDIVLDFFAGSGTTAHSILELNSEDQIDRKYICVQMPELTSEGSEASKAGYRDIAAICKERIRRVGKKFNKRKGDFGFKVYRLAKSHFKLWEDYDGTNLEHLEKKLSLFETPLIENWKHNNLLTEILLLEGFSLESSIKSWDASKKNKIYTVSSDFCDHKLVVCLDKDVESKDVLSLTMDHNDVFICLDNAIKDETKMRLADICKLKTI